MSKELNRTERMVFARTKWEKSGPKSKGPGNVLEFGYFDKIWPKYSQESCLQTYI